MKIVIDGHRGLDPNAARNNLFDISAFAALPLPLQREGWDGVFVIFAVPLSEGHKIVGRVQPAPPERRAI